MQLVTGEAGSWRTATAALPTCVLLLRSLIHPDALCRKIAECTQQQKTYPDPQCANSTHYGGKSCSSQVSQAYREASHISYGMECSRLDMQVSPGLSLEAPVCVSRELLLILTHSMMAVNNVRNTDDCCTRLMTFPLSDAGALTSAVIERGMQLVLSKHWTDL
jgi:hypothetical protein